MYIQNNKKDVLLQIGDEGCYLAYAMNPLQKFIHKINRHESSFFLIHDYTAHILRNRKRLSTYRSQFVRFSFVNVSIGT